MRVSTLATFLLPALLLSSCQMPYLISGASEQIRILSKRTPIKKALKSGKLSTEETSKLKYAQKASEYAKLINLKCENNFKTYVKLNRPYVSYLVIASSKDELKLKKWSFPIFGSFPYLGFFSEKKALNYQARLIKKDYDTYVRGASAYSSLGWFNEPILSSMINSTKEGIAETIFHECFHGTFFLKGQVELNERLAVFIAHKSLLNFLKESKPLLNKELKAWEDQKLFSAFLKKILVKVEILYNQKEKTRTEIFNFIKTEYLAVLKPNLKILNYDKLFLNEDLNNAKLLAFKTYFHDFSDLEEIFKVKFNSEVVSMIKYFQSLEGQKYKVKVNKLKTLKLM